MRMPKPPGPESVVHSLFMGKNRFPFLFRWIGGRIVVTRDLTSEGSLKPGWEILAIDGHRVDENPLSAHDDCPRRWRQ